MEGNAEKRMVKCCRVLYVRSVICDPSNYDKTKRSQKLARESKWHTFRECVRLFEIAATAKISISRKFIYVYLCRWNRLFYVLQQQRCHSTNEARSNSIFIFDDVACDKQDAMREYFSMGRHSNVDCFYLCQTYARIPKHLIRDNANLLILFNRIVPIWNTFTMNIDMSYDEFCLLCRDYWQKNMAKKYF